MQRRARLAIRHRLAPQARADSPAEVATSLVALHSSDPATVYLSAAARLRSPSIEAVAAALHVDRSIVRHHGMRRTLWVCTPSDARVVHAACTEEIARKEWRQLTAWVAGSGIDDPDQWIRDARAATLAAVHRLGPTSARALGKAVPALTAKIKVGAGKYETEQAAHTRLLLNLGFDGALVRTAPTGSWTSSEYAWSVTEDWLPHAIAGDDPVAARAALVARYLQGFGPASTADVQWWTGLPMAAVKPALAAAQAVEVQLDDGTPAWLLPADLEPLDEPEPWVALLPALDPTPMGWKSRDWYLGEYAAFGGPLFDRNGNVGPTVWSNGLVVGGWAQRPDGRIAVAYLRPVDARVTDEVAATAQRLQSLIGAQRVTPRFPTPLQKELTQG